jgi:Zn-dependent protease with chaperone function
VKRRPGRTLLALAAPLVLYVAFGMARVTAPVSALGLVFHEPLGFAIAAAALALAGALLLFARPVELAFARLVAGESRPPSAGEGRRLEPLLARVAARAGMDPARLILRVIDDPGVNASAGAAHLLFVTTGALELPDDELEAVLAHEAGHHRGLHPLVTAVVWWLSLPGLALSWVYRLLKRAVASLGRLGAAARLVAVPLLLVVILWQVLVMWIFLLGELLAKRAARVSEFEADEAAARWGYAAPLAAALERLEVSEAAPGGLVARLSAEHPPVGERIARLRARQRTRAPT